MHSSEAQEGRVLSIKLLRESGEGPAQQKLWAEWSYSATSVVGELHSLLSATFCGLCGPHRVVCHQHLQVSARL